MDILQAFHQESFLTYSERKTTHLNAHSMMEFHRDPSIFKALRDGVISRPDTSAYSIGRALHVLVCEGRETYDTQYVTATPDTGCPVNPKTGYCYGLGTKATANWEAEQAVAGRAIISAADAALVEAMYFQIKSTKCTHKLFDGGMGEAVCVGSIGDVPAQCRTDYIHADGVIVDLKTCANIETFEADALKYMYWYQAAFYDLLVTQRLVELGQMTSREAQHDGLCVIFAAVEKQSPCRVCTRVYSPETMAIAKKVVYDDMQECWDLLQEGSKFTSPYTYLQEFRDLSLDEMKRGRN